MRRFIVKISKQQAMGILRKTGILCSEPFKLD